MKIHIIGAGLAGLTAVKYLISEGVDPSDITVITSSERQNEKGQVNPQYVHYFKNLNKKIGLSVNPKEIDMDSLSKSFASKSNIVGIHNLGGLGKYWGGGIDLGFMQSPESISIEEDESRNAIESMYNLVSIIDSPHEKIITKLSKATSHHGISVIAKKKVNPCNPLKIEILNPADELRRLQNDSFIGIREECRVKKIEYNKGLALTSIILEDGEKVPADWVILCAGTIGTTKILLNSGLLPSNRRTITDHAIFRFALLSPLKLLKAASRSGFSIKDDNPNPPRENKNSIIESYKISVGKKYQSFLGIYSLKHYRSIVPGCLRLFVRSNSLNLAQLYVGGNTGKIKADFFSFCEVHSEGNTFSHWHENLKLILLIKDLAVLFIRNGIIAIPLGRRLPFGSSYHLHGTISKAELKIIHNRMPNLLIGDMSICADITASPPSFIQMNSLIKNLRPHIQELRRK